MEVLKFLAAVSPITVALTGILAFKKKAATVAPIALCWTVFRYSHF